MTTTDKAKNTAQQAKGKLKETVGKVSGNDKLRAEGKADQVKGDIKQAGEKLKDAFKKSRDSPDRHRRAGYGHSEPKTEARWTIGCSS